MGSGRKRDWETWKTWVELYDVDKVQGKWTPDGSKMLGFEVERFA